MTSTYFIVIGIVVFLVFVVYSYSWIYKRGKEKGAKELEKDVKAWLEKNHKAIWDDLNSGDAPFGSVQKPDAVWKTPS